MNEKHENFFCQSVNSEKIDYSLCNSDILNDMNRKVRVAVLDAVGITPCFTSCLTPCNNHIRHYLPYCRAGRIRPEALVLCMSHLIGSIN